MGSSEEPSPDLICLDLPGDPSYGSIARTAAMTLGLRAGFDWPTLENLALAVDEAMILLLKDRGAEATLRLQFTTSKGSLDLEASTTDDEDPQRPPDLGALERFGEIVSGTVDVWEVDADQRALRLRVTRTVDDAAVR